VKAKGAFVTYNSLPGTSSIRSEHALTRRIAVTFLIDGYNLMHAVGLLRQGVPKGELERARTKFLNWLATTAKDRSTALRVVFDARSAPRPSPESEYRGMRILFAFHQTADDLIEEILDAETLPARITVVSNDTRIQASGHRRGATVNTCEQFVDWLIEDSHGSSSPQPLPDKPEQRATADEMAKWLEAFSAPKRKRR
jgi:predicted RNA-binding protein with PIN domain